MNLTERSRATTGKYQIHEETGGSMFSGYARYSSSLSMQGPHSALPAELLDFLSTVFGNELLETGLGFSYFSDEHLLRYILPEYK